MSHLVPQQSWSILSRYLETFRHGTLVWRTDRHEDRFVIATYVSSVKGQLNIVSSLAPGTQQLHNDSVTRWCAHVKAWCILCVFCYDKFYHIVCVIVLAQAFYDRLDLYFLWQLIWIFLLFLARTTTEEEREDKYNRLLAASLQTFSMFLSALTDSQREEIVDKIGLLLKNVKFLKFGKHYVGMVCLVMKLL